MATCNKCGHKYYSKECPECNNEYYENIKKPIKNTKIVSKNINENIQNNKTIIKYSNKRHANFTIRLMANIIDIVIYIPIIIILHNTYILDFIIALITIIFWVTWNGQTIGKKIVNIKVVDTNYKEIKIEKAILRYLGYILSTILLLIGYSIIPFRKDKQALHDLIAKTYVIHTDDENTNIENDGVDKFLAIFLTVVGTFLMISYILNLYLAKETEKIMKMYDRKANKTIKKHETIKEDEDIYKKFNINNMPKSLF